MARRRDRSEERNEESSYFGTEEGEYCRVCHQEFAGSCPLGSAQCPFNRDDEEADEIDEEPDFEDVDNLNTVLDKDEEADKLTEAGEDIPPEDLAE